MLIGIVCLSRVGPSRRHHESVIGMNEFCLVGRVVSGARPPGGMSSVGSAMAMTVIDVLARGNRVIQEMSDRGLASTA